MAQIKTYEFGLETVTPLFLGGAQPRGKLEKLRAPELRASSFRGALRYWLRAALGGLYGDDAEGLALVRRREARVFGSTEKDLGGASAVAVRLHRTEMKNPLDWGGHKAQWVRGKPQPFGVDYLFWSMPGQGKTPPPDRKYFPSGSEFELQLRGRPGAEDGDKSLREAVYALWLLVQLGGIGARSRRTGGGLCALKAPSFKVSDDRKLYFPLRASQTAAVAEELAAGITLVRSLLRQRGPRGELSTPPGFDVLHPEHCRIWVLGTWKTEEEARETIGAAMRDFRSRTPPDYANVAKWLGGASIPTVERAVFGLPIPYHYSSGPKGVLTGRTSPKQSSIERRASPLWLKVSKTGNGRYAGVATLFKSRFLPPGEMLHEKDGKGPPLPPPADYSLIEQFIADQFIKTKFKAQEVHYE